jgi:hypothetical protein
VAQPLGRYHFTSLRQFRGNSMNSEFESPSWPPNLANDPRLPGKQSLAFVDAAEPVALGSAPPDWRWRRAQDIYKRQQPAIHAEDDAWIIRAVAYLTKASGCPDFDEHHALWDEYHDLHGAILLHAHGAPLPVAILRARLLAGTPLDEIARLCSLPLTVIIAYEALFYLVRTRRAQAVALQFEVIAPDVWLRHARGDYGATLRLLGLFHGPEVLEAGIRVLVEDSPRPGDQRLVLPILIDGLRRHWAQEAAKASLGDASSTSVPVAGLFSLFPRWARYTSPLREMPGRPKHRNGLPGRIEG